MLDGESDSGSLARENFLKAKIDRISKSANILAVRQDDDTLIHVDRGKIGETAIAFVEDGNLNAARAGKRPAKVIGYDTIESAIDTLSTDSPLQIKRGERFKVGNRTVIEDGQTKIKTPKLNIDYIVAEGLARDREEDVLKIDSIEGNLAFASVECEGTWTTYTTERRDTRKDEKPVDTQKRPWAKPSASEQKESESSDEEDTKNPFKKKGGDYIHLLK